MKKLVLLAMTFCVTALCFAKQISPDQAMLVGSNQLKGSSTLKSAKSLTLVYQATDQLKSTNQSVYYYVFNATDGHGFVIVAGDDAVSPIIGYSDTGTYDVNNLPPALQSWMQETANGIAYAIKTKNAQTEDVKAKWDAYLNGNVVQLKSAKSVSALIRTLWGQYEPYNNLCPHFQSRRSDRAATGCTATAMAQIMYYHMYNNKCNIQPSGTTPVYTTKTQHIKIPALNLSKVSYNYKLMTWTYSQPRNAAQRAEVAKLMYDCGVAAQMDYALDANNGASGAWVLDAAKAFFTYFGYDKSLQYLDRGLYTNSVWRTKIIAEIEAKRPVLYEGIKTGNEAHTFVCDGYDGSNGLFHFNFGFYGECNGYFSLDSPDGYASGQLAIVGLKKNQGGGFSHQILVKKISAPATVKQGNKFTLTALLSEENPLGQYFAGRGRVALFDANNKYIAFIDTKQNYFGCYICQMPKVSPGKYKLQIAAEFTKGKWTKLDPLRGGSNFAYIQVTNNPYYSTQVVKDVETPEASSQFNVYPNPVHDVLNISLPSQLKVQSIIVVNMQGLVVKKINTANFVGNIRVDDLSAGIYILQVQTETGILTKKFIKE